MLLHHVKQNNVLQETMILMTFVADRRPRVPQIVVRRARNSAMAAVPFAIYAFLARIASRAPDFFKIPHERVLEVGFHIEI